jgi:Flp pilus assembly protein TadD
MALAVTLNDLKRHEEARNAFRELIDTTPNDADAWEGYGESLMGLGSSDDAARSFENALHLERTNPGALANLAICRKVAGDCSGPCESAEYSPQQKRQEAASKKR